MRGDEAPSNFWINPTSRITKKKNREKETLSLWLVGVRLRGRTLEVARLRRRPGRLPRRRGDSNRWQRWRWWRNGSGRHLGFYRFGSNGRSNGTSSAGSCHRRRVILVFNIFGKEYDKVRTSYRGNFFTGPVTYNPS